MYTNRKKDSVILMDKRPPGTVTYATYTPWVEVSRTDTVRRRKPRALRSSQTSMSTTVQETFPLTFYSKDTSGLYEAITEAGEYGGRGRCSDTSYVTRGITCCENKARAKFRNGGVNLAQIFAEYKKTADLFPTLGKRAYEILRTFRWRKRALNRFKGDPTRRMSKDLLIYLYGVKPLMMDLYDSYEEMTKASKTWKPSNRIVATHNEYHDENPKEWPLRYSATKIANTRLGSCRIVCAYDVLYNTAGVVDFLARHGLTNPLSLLWELTPYSFVLDWWIGVGESLESLDNLLLVAGNQGYTSWHVNETCLHAGAVTYRYTEKKRQAKSLSLLTVPTYKTKTSGSHIAATLALLRGLKRG